MLLFLDDLIPGRRFTSATQTVTRDDILAFARAYDPQPFHLDDVAAAASLFGGLVASGWHTAALTMRLLVESLPVAGGLIGAGGDVTWPEPTRPGDALRVTSEVVRVMPSRSKPDRGSVVLRCETLNQHGTAVQIMQPRLVVPRRTEDRGGFAEP